MKTLIAVISCHKNADTRVRVVRETWLKNVRPDIDVRFFYGYGQHDMQADEILVSADDSYLGLIHKMKSVFRWVVKNGYDLVLKADDDTFLTQEVLTALSVSPELDYVGYSTATAFNAPLYTDHLMADPKTREEILFFGGNYACGGAYRLTRRALNILNQTKLNEKSFQFMGIDSLYAKSDMVPCEDYWVGHTLTSRGVELTHSTKYAGFTDNLDFIKPLIEKDISRCQTAQDLKGLLMFAPLRHFNCDEAQMRRLYEKDLHGTLSASQ